MVHLKKKRIPPKKDDEETEPLFVDQFVLSPEKPLPESDLEGLGREQAQTEYEPILLADASDPFFIPTSPMQDVPTAPTWSGQRTPGPSTGGRLFMPEPPPVLELPPIAASPQVLAVDHSIAAQIVGSAYRSAMYMAGGLAASTAAAPSAGQTSTTSSTSARPANTTVPTNTSGTTAVSASASEAILTNTGLTSSIQSGGTTKDKTLGFTGTAKAGSTVAIYDDDGATLLGNAQLSETNWTYTTSELADGTHHFTVKITEGSTSVDKNLTATIDTQAQGTLSSHVLTDAGNKASVTAYDLTTDHTLGLTGTAEANSTVKIYDNDVFLGNATLTETAWQFDSGTLVNGGHVLSAQITDQAGNALSTANVKVGVHDWSDTSGLGAIDALAAINLATHQTLADITTSGLLPWGIKSANMNDAWQYGYTGKGIRIAIIDSGIDLTNTDLAASVNTSLSWNFGNNSSNITDTSGHGTCVASEIIAANNSVGLTGAAYEAELMVLKVVDDTGTLSTQGIVKAMSYAVDNGAKIINMSLGAKLDSGSYYDDPRWAGALQYAKDHDVLVVIAAGNDAYSTPSPPALHAIEYDNVLAVGALLRNSDESLSLSSFSNLSGSGPYGFVDAAGSNIAGYNEKGDSLSWNGTSMAAPYVTAEAALILSAANAMNMTLTAEELAWSIAATTRYAIV